MMAVEPITMLRQPRKYGKQVFRELGFLSYLTLGEINKIVIFNKLDVLNIIASGKTYLESVRQ